MVGLPKRSFAPPSIATIWPYYMINMHVSSDVLVSQSKVFIQYIGDEMFDQKKLLK
jgi:hypothetical protein